jgi:hypothetical protein
MAPLYINGTSGISGVDGSAATPALQGTDTNTGISFGSDVIIASTGGTERWRTDASGRLLVGTSTSVNNLLDGALQIVGTSADSYITATRYSSVAGDPAGIVLGRSKSATKGTNTIVASGDALGAISFSGANGTSFDQAASIVAFVDGTPGASGDMPGRLVFSTTADGAASPTERMRLTSTGALLIGGTNISTGKLFVSANIPAETSQRIALFSGSGAGDAILEGIAISKFDNNSTTAQIFQRFYINNGTGGSGQINANGSGAAAFGSFSDARLKENIVDIPSQLQNICSLRPVEFDYKDGSGHQIGFIAQEMEQVYPDAVAQGTDDMLTVTGWSKTEARLVKALQEAIAKIETIEAKVAALEAA